MAVEAAINCGKLFKFFFFQVLLSRLDNNGYGGTDGKKLTTKSFHGENLINFHSDSTRWSVSHVQRHHRQPALQQKLGETQVFLLSRDFWCGSFEMFESGVIQGCCCLQRTAKKISYDFFSRLQLSKKKIFYEKHSMLKVMWLRGWASVYPWS